MTKEALLTKLQSEPLKWVLCGSRFFNSATKSSDWDFFTQDDPKIVKELEELGFQPYHSEYALDYECIRLFRHYEYNIDVLLQRDLNLARIAREIITEEIPLFGEVDEQLRGYIWRAVKKALRSQPKVPWKN